MGPLTLCRLTGGSIGLSVLHTVDELLEADLGGVFWISAPRLHPDEYRVLGERLGLHPMVISDLSHAARRASHEDYGSYSHLALNLACEDTKGRLRRKNIQFLRWQERLVSFCEHGEEQFAATFELLRSGYLRPDDDLVIRSFCLAMSDILRDAAALAERIDARIDALEDELFRGVQSSQLERIHDLKSGTLEIRRTTVPMRDAFLMLLRGGGDLMSQNVYLRDVGEQIAQLCEMAENSRETVADLADLYMTLMSNSTNAVMKTLTLVSTIFIPITFIVGLYGMNFRYMPELGWRYGYPACLLLMAAVSAGMVLYFRKKKWM